MKDAIKELLLEFQNGFPANLIKRNINIPTLPRSIRKALVFIGMRRVGKTYLMYQHMIEQINNGLDKKKIVYMNFEDDRLQAFTAKDFQIILDIYFELYPDLVEAEDINFYFDEIQNIDGWEKFIRRLIDKEKMHIYITGSSAKSLSKEIATSLRGRCLTQEVFPLSFAEFLQYKDINNTNLLTNKQKSIIKHYCQSYLAQGGFPETLELSANLQRQAIQSYINAAVFRDVVERHQLSNPHIVKLFLTHCLQNIAAPLSITKVFNTFKSRGEKLSRSILYSYLDYFEDAYLLYTVPLFDLSTRKRHVNPSKIYCVDCGVINAYSIKPQMEIGVCLENAVYIHLRKEISDSIFYYKTQSGKEIDFVVQKINGALQLFQVCLNANDEQTRQREVSAIIEAAQELDLQQAWIITFDEIETIVIKNLTIHVLPYWQWVLRAVALM